MGSSNLFPELKQIEPKLVFLLLKYIHIVLNRDTFNSHKDKCPGHGINFLTLLQDSWVDNGGIVRIDIVQFSGE